MGCASSTHSLEEIDFSSGKITKIESHELHDYIEKFNEMYDGLNSHLEMAKNIKRKWDKFVEEFSLPDVNKYSLSMSFAIAYLTFTLSLYYNCCLIPNCPKEKFYFTNYLPGILIDEEKLKHSTENTGTDVGSFTEELINKYNALKDFSNEIYSFISKFNHEEIIENMRNLNSEMIKDAYNHARNVSGWKIVLEFREIENEILKNINEYGVVALALDQFFKDTCITIKNIEKIVSKCSEDFTSIKNIVRGNEQWKYWESTREDTEKFHKFIVENIQILPLSRDLEI